MSSPLTLIEEKLVAERGHIPVMLTEVIENLNLRPGSLVLDCTVGLGGHSERILEEILPGGKLIGIDKDEESLRLAQQRLFKFKGNFYLFHDNFVNLKRLLKSLNIEKVDAVLFDLGISSFQLEGGRGFSFREDSFLDMRMDKDQKLTAYDIVNYYPKEQISRILKEFGEERYHERIADQIVRARSKEPIRTTKQLVDVILKAVPTSYLRYKIHPATRTFQALRIAVNRELENLEKGLNEAIDVLMPGGRIAVISFHSLEDRIVKLTFKKHKKLGTLDIMTPKPLRPTEIEVNSNPRSRSAKLRVAQRRVNGNSNLLMKILML